MFRTFVKNKTKISVLLILLCVLFVFPDTSLGKKKRNNDSDEFSGEYAEEGQETEISEKIATQLEKILNFVNKNQTPGTEELDLTEQVLKNDKRNLIAIIL